MGAGQPETDLTQLSGIGPKLAARLQSAGYLELRHLALAVPSRYRAVHAQERPDRGLLGSEVRLPVQVRAVSRLRTRRGLAFSQLRGMLRGEPELKVEARFFGQPWIAKQVQSGSERILSGRLEAKGRHFELVAPRIAPPSAEFAPGRILEPQRVSPVEGISAERFGRLARAAIDACGELLADAMAPSLLRELELLPLREALLELHEPSGESARMEAARRRLAALEAAALLAHVRRRREQRSTRPSWPVQVDRELDTRIRARLPFALSEEQDRAALEICADMEGPAPMARLLMGDVGCGKTLVAVYACLAAAACGHKSVLLAPTELLAEQHAARISELLSGSRLPVLRFTASQSKAERDEALAQLASPRPCLAVGTHALLSAEIRYQRLGLLVIDEQQRFGVAQRAALWREHGGRWPHVLVMSATPIPRTLATALFGDLELSEIRKPPVPRPKPVTELLPPEAWPQLRARIVQEIEGGGRVFVVCPRIGEGAGGEEDGAVATFAELEGLVPSSLVHGKVKADARRKAQEDFRSGRRPCLVGTTVLEVGIDVPEATMMIVRGAERLGLSTLHQLRGRVGRGDRPARCILLRDPAAERLAVLAECHDGFELAEADLRQRGAGELTGLLQSGHQRFRCLDLLGDLDLLRAAREGLLRDSSEPPLSSFAFAAPDRSAERGAAESDQADSSKR
jgi:ATP-dependent DNA helicase RecG